MALYPALPLFTDAYLADTRHPTPEIGIQPKRLLQEVLANNRLRVIFNA